MAWQDRDYNRSRPEPSAGFKVAGHSFVFWLIAINAAVFLLDHLLMRSIGPVNQLFSLSNGAEVTLKSSPIESLGYFSAATAIQAGNIWRFITFQFLHADFGHILFNMLGLYFFGPMVESYLGSRRFLAFYLCCGIAGATAYIVLWTLGFLVSSPIVPLVGASAGVLGVLMAAAAIAPNTRVMLIFPPIPMKLKTMAWIMVGIGVYTVLFMGHRAGSNAGGEAAHLGGCALGFFLIRRPSWLNFADWSAGGPSRPKPAKRPAKQKPAVDEQEVDRILDKVREQGLASLSNKEQKVLKSASDAKRRVG